MITIIVAALLGGAEPVDTNIHNFLQCLHDTDASARSQKIAPDRYDDFAKQRCASAQAAYQTSLTSEDVKHGMSHREAVSDAASIIDSYYSERRDNYQAYYKRNQSADADNSSSSPPKVTAPLTPASTPK